MVASPTPPTRAAEPYRDSPSVQTAVSSCSMPTERRQTSEPAARPSISRSPVTVVSCIRPTAGNAPSAHFASARAAHFHLSLRCRASPLARTVWPRADDKGSGVFPRRLQPDPAGGLTFYPAFPPTDAEVAQLLDTTRRRVGRLHSHRVLPWSGICQLHAACARFMPLVGTEIRTFSREGRVFRGAQQPHVRCRGHDTAAVARQAAGPRGCPLDHENDLIGS